MINLYLITCWPIVGPTFFGGYNYKWLNLSVFGFSLSFLSRRVVLAWRIVWCSQMVTINPTMWKCNLHRSAWDRHIPAAGTQGLLSHLIRRGRCLHGRPFPSVATRWPEQMLEFAHQLSLPQSFWFWRKCGLGRLTRSQSWSGSCMAHRLWRWVSGRCNHGCI